MSAAAAKAGSPARPRPRTPCAKQTKQPAVSGLPAGSRQGGGRRAARSSCSSTSSASERGHTMRQGKRARRGPGRQNPSISDEQGGGTMKDLTITLEDRPGRLADLGEATGKAGINIEGLCATIGGGRAEIHVLVDDDAAAREALSSAGIDVDAQSDVLVGDGEDRPGTMGDVARKLADAGVNIGLAYAAFGGVKLVLGVDDLEKGRSAL